MKFDNTCPFCGSINIEVENNTQPEWGNNDEAIMEEDWSCRNCHKAFSTHSKIEVVRRELTMNVVCPYCGDSMDLQPIDNLKDLNGYRCGSCKRYFYIHPEEYYQRRIE